MQPSAEPKIPPDKQSKVPVPDGVFLTEFLKALFFSENPIFETPKQMTTELNARNGQGVVSTDYSCFDQSAPGRYTYLRLGFKYENQNARATNTTHTTKTNQTTHTYGYFPNTEYILEIYR